MKKALKIAVTIFVAICILFLVSMTFIKFKKPSFFENIFPKLSYTTKDWNMIKNYKEYVEKDNKRKALYDTYRTEFGDKNAKKYLNLGSGFFYNQGVHPDILKLKEKEDVYYMAYTPYPYGRDKYENPHIVKSSDGIKFKPEKGVKNPLVDTPSDYSDGGHLSDTDLVYENGKFMLYYVYNKKGVAGGTKIYLIDSKDGINWSEPIAIYDTREGYSPTIVKDKDGFKMWHIEGEGNLVVSESKDGYKWETYKKAKINLGDWLAWHIDIQKTSTGYEGFVCARNPELNTRALFYMASENGMDWKTSEKPILFPTEDGWDNKEIYRSTFIKEDDKYRLWYSARGDYYKWRVGYTEYTVDEIRSLKLQ